MSIAGSSNGRIHDSESCHLGSNPSPAAEFNNANREFSDERVRSPSPAKGGAGLALVAAGG